MPLVRRRRPLLRAAAVGGGAYMAGKHRANAQAAQEQQYDEPPPQQYSEPPPQQYAPPPPSGPTPEALEQLKQLGSLHEQGILTDEEFAQQKAKLLN
jgi:hypothetical protein